MTVGISSTGTQVVYDVYKEPSTFHSEAIHVDDGAVRIDHDREHVIHISSNLPSTQSYIRCDTLSGVVKFSVDSGGTVYSKNATVSGTITNVALETRLTAIEGTNTSQGQTSTAIQTQLDTATAKNLTQDPSISSLHAADMAQNTLAASHLAATNQTISDNHATMLASQAAQDTTISDNHATMLASQAAQDTTISDNRVDVL